MCMTIKFRPKEHWKVISKNIDGKHIDVVPVWKVLSVSTNASSAKYGVGIESILQTYYWEKNCWHGAYIDNKFCKFCKDDDIVVYGFHCYYRKSDAIKMLPFWKRYFSGFNLGIFKMYTKPEDIINKGYSSYDEHCNIFKSGLAARNFYNKEQFMERYKVAPTLVTKALYFPEQ